MLNKFNKPGTAEVGVISKAQKYSRNNYCEIFQLSHSAEKYPKGFSSPKLENSFFSELETSEKNNLPLEFFFKKVFDKKVTYCRKTQREKTLQAHKTFFFHKTKISKIFKGYPLIEFKKFPKKIA